MGLRFAPPASPLPRRPASAKGSASVIALRPAARAPSPLQRALRAWLAADRKRTPKALSTAAGLNPTAVRDILEGKSRHPRQDTLEKLARAMGTPVQGLIERPRARGHGDAIAAFGEDYAAVPVYDVRASAGPGAFAENGEPLTHHLFRSQWLRAVTAAAPHELAVLRVDGDSMWETLHNGDHVLVDRTVSAAGRDGIYVLRAGAELQIKRLQRQPNGKLTVRSDNPAYASFPDVRPDQITIVGRVIWLGRHV